MQLFVTNTVNRDHQIEIHAIFTIFFLEVLEQLVNFYSESVSIKQINRHDYNMLHYEVLAIQADMDCSL